MVREGFFQALLLAVVVAAQAEVMVQVAMLDQGQLAEQVVHTAAVLVVTGKALEPPAVAAAVLFVSSGVLAEPFHQQIRGTCNA
jgi:hypothetical protein